MAKVVAKYKMDTSNNTIELYLPEDSDGATALNDAIGVETTTATVDGVSYTGFKFIDQIVVNEGLEDALITTAKIANLAVSTEKLNDLVVESSKLADSAVEASKIANLAVGTAAIANLAVSEAKLGNASVTNAKIDNLAVNDAKIADLSANKIDTGTLSAARIAAGSLDAGKITSNTITSTQISGTQLDVLAANCGTLTVDEALTVATGGSFLSGMTAAATGSGYWFDKSGGTPRMYLGTGTTGTMDTGISVVGSTTTVHGNLIATGNVNANGITKTSASQTDTANAYSTSTAFQSVTGTSLDTSSPVLVMASFLITARSAPGAGSSNFNFNIRKSTTDELFLGSCVYNGSAWTDGSLRNGSRVTAFWWDTSAGAASVTYDIHIAVSGSGGSIQVDDRIIVSMQTKR